MPAKQGIWCWFIQEKPGLHGVHWLWPSTEKVPWEQTLLTPPEQEYPLSQGKHWVALDEPNDDQLPLEHNVGEMAPLIQK